MLTLINIYSEENYTCPFTLCIWNCRQLLGGPDLGYALHAAAIWDARARKVTYLGVTKHDAVTKLIVYLIDIKN
jgi:hypothetical protein